MNKVFIHTNHKQMLGASVSKYTIEKFSDHNDLFSVEFIQLSDYEELTSKQGQKYLRKNYIDSWDNDDLQSFTLLRFLPPQLMNYQGKVIVIDPDVFSVFIDIYDLFSQDMHGKAIKARKIYSNRFELGYYYASSVMMLDCQQLTHWRWNEIIEKLFNKEIDYRDLLSLYLEDKDNIDNLDNNWNSFDELNINTKLLHNTGRLTQAWKTGLPVDFSVSEKHQKPRLKSRIMNKLSKIINLKDSPAKMQDVKLNKFYKKHPDPNQESFFFTMLNDAIADNYIDLEFVKEEIAKGYIRKDCLEILTYYKENPFNYNILLEDKIAI